MLRLIIPLIFFTVSCTKPAPEPRNDAENAIIPLILISIDGFRPDYLTKIETPNLRNLAAEGVISDGMIPVFPSLTFPNHYSLVTGLYAEHTGLVSNTMYDPLMDERFSLGNRAAVSDGRWYGGEPVWVTAEMQDIRTAAMFWPGSEAEIRGIRPTRWMVYDGTIPNKSRVDSVITWLTLTDETRPDFMTLYFSDVDSYGHYYGPNSDSLTAAVKAIDSVMGYLITELKRTGFYDRVNLMITSDHGMAEMSSERVIFLDEIINIDDVNVITYSAATMIQPKTGKHEAVYDVLKSRENDYAFSIYEKKNIPVRFRIKNHHRVPDILLLADVGWSITTRPYFEARGVVAGAHGFDNTAPDMAALFIARGPSIKQGERIPGFEAVHVYEFLCKLLNITPAQNDGNPKVLVPVLR